MLKIREARAGVGGVAKIIDLTGSLDANFADEYGADLDALDSESGGNYAIGWKGVRYVCSRVLGSTISFATKIRAGGGHVVLFDVPAEVLKVMEIVEFHAFFRICDDEAEALTVLGGEIPAPKQNAKPCCPRWVVVAVIVAALAGLGVAAAFLLPGLFS